MTTACRALGHYFPNRMYEHLRDDGQVEWRQQCARCPLSRTAPNPHHRSDSQEGAEMLWGPYGERWERFGSRIGRLFEQGSFRFSDR
jgi:hypothetical protein